MGVAKVSLQMKAVRSTDDLRLEETRDAIVQAVKDVALGDLNGTVQIVHNTVPFPVCGADQCIPHRFLTLDERCEVRLKVWKCHGSAFHLVTLVTELRECVFV